MLYHYLIGYIMIVLKDLEMGRALTELVGSWYFYLGATADFFFRFRNLERSSAGKTPCNES